MFACGCLSVAPALPEPLSNFPTFALAFHPAPFPYPCFAISRMTICTLFEVVGGAAMPVMLLAGDPAILGQLHLDLSLRQLHKAAYFEGTEENKISPTVSPKLSHGLVPFFFLLFPFSLLVLHERELGLGSVFEASPRSVLRKSAASQHVISPRVLDKPEGRNGGFESGGMLQKRRVICASVKWRRARMVNLFSFRKTTSDGSKE